MVGGGDGEISRVNCFAAAAIRLRRGGTAIMVRGDDHLPVVATEMGRITSAICFEADFPEFVRQIGRGHADLWVLPANDWEAFHECPPFSR
jgi:hypothetical protein